MKAFFETLKPQIELAEKGNARLAIENHGGDLLNTFESGKQNETILPMGVSLGDARMFLGRFRGTAYQ
jgi:hypothetical protein